MFFALLTASLAKSPRHGHHTHHRPHSIRIPNNSTGFNLYYKPTPKPVLKNMTTYIIHVPTVTESGVREVKFKNADDPNFYSTLNNLIGKDKAKTLCQKMKFAKTESKDYITLGSGFSTSRRFTRDNVLISARRNVNTNEITLKTYKLTTVLDVTVYGKNGLYTALTTNQLNEIYNSIDQYTKYRRSNAIKKVKA